VKGVPFFLFNPSRNAKNFSRYPWPYSSTAYSCDVWVLGTGQILVPQNGMVYCK
jgi:hypothetical protein